MAFSKKKERNFCGDDGDDYNFDFDGPSCNGVL